MIALAHGKAKVVIARQRRADELKIGQAQGVNQVLGGQRLHDRRVVLPAGQLAQRFFQGIGGGHPLAEPEPADVFLRTVSLHDDNGLVA